MSRLEHAVHWVMWPTLGYRQSRRSNMRVYGGRRVQGHGHVGIPVKVHPDEDGLVRGTSSWTGSRVALVHYVVIGAYVWRRGKPVAFGARYRCGSTTANAQIVREVGSRKMCRICVALAEGDAEK